MRRASKGILHTRFKYIKELLEPGYFARYLCLRAHSAAARPSAHDVDDIVCKISLLLYTRYPIVARRAWPAGRVRRASKGILHTIFARARTRPEGQRYDILYTSDDRVSCLQLSSRIIPYPGALIPQSQTNNYTQIFVIFY